MLKLSNKIWLMKQYLAWQTINLKDFSAAAITEQYNMGFVLVRTRKGEMQQTRSVRIDLSKFTLSSENRRVLNKLPNLNVETIDLPIAVADYSWSIHKLGKDFYKNKFGSKIFSAGKIKQLLIDSNNSSFNLLLKYSENGQALGYAIAYHNAEMLHYTYPFYDFQKYSNNYGMGMMLKAILWAKASSKKYIYLGSATEAADKYKLQFSGLSWFDGTLWSDKLEKLKNLLESRKN